MENESGISSDGSMFLVHNADVKMLFLPLFSCRPPYLLGSQAAAMILTGWFALALTLAASRIRHTFVSTTTSDAVPSCATSFSFSALEIHSLSPSTFAFDFCGAA